MWYVWFGILSEAMISNMKGIMMGLAPGIYSLYQIYILYTIYIFLSRGYNKFPYFTFYCRRRMETEAKAKVVAAVWGTEFT